jgi:hypothetical protein
MRGQPPAVFPLTAESGLISSVAISADGRRVAVTTTNSYTQIWEVRER